MKPVLYRPIAPLLVGPLLLSPGITHASDSESDLFLGRVGDSTLDRNVNSSQGAVQITAANEGSSASLRFGSEFSSTDTDDQTGRFSTWNLLFTAPLNKDQDINNVATLDGLTNAFTAKFVFNAFHWPGIPEAERLRDQALFDEICAEALRGYVANGGKEADFSCDTNMVKIHANHRYAEFRPHVIKEADPAKLDTWRIVWGFSGTVGYETFDYRDPTSLEKDDTSEIPWSVGAHFGFMPPIKDHQILVTLGYDYQEAYKKQDESVRCPVDPRSSSVSCVTGSFGEPDHRRKQLGYLELRGLIAGFGVSLKYTHDFENNINGLDMPLYLFRNKNDNLTAGLRFGWNDDSNDFQAGVFVGSGFKLFQ